MNAVSVHRTVRWRATLSIIVGIGTGIATGITLGTAAGILAGWGALALVNVVWVLLVVWRMDAAETKLHATGEDPGRGIARVIALIGSLMSLAAVIVVLVQARAASGIEEIALAGIAVLSVVASWALIQVDYMLRYARIYYQDPVGGITFNQEEAPEYSDFAYFSVGLGMTYQVADTNVTSNGLRRIVIAQTMIAYLFGAVILGTIINIITGLG